MGKQVAFNKRVGCRFHLMQMVLPVQARPGQPIEAQPVIDNKGVGPICRRYRFALRFSQGQSRRIVRLNQDIRRWLPALTMIGVA